VPKNPKQTSKKTATKASEEMKDEGLPPAAKSAVASALGQTPYKKKKK
jgi:hypothetical protein